MYALLTPKNGVNEVPEKGGFGIQPLPDCQLTSFKLQRQLPINFVSDKVI